MAKFCGKCGSRLDTTTGLCPNCDVEQLAAIRSEKFTDAGKVQEFYPDAPLLTEPNNQEVAFANPAKKDGMGNAEPVSNDRPLSKKEAKKQRKKEKKTAKKALKKGKHAQWSAGGKIGRFFLKIILILLLLAVLVVGLMEAFIYFDIADIPAIENIIKRVELLSGNNGRDIGTDDDSLLKDFTSNENYFWESEQVNVVFSVSIQGKKPDYVDLYSDDKFVCQMLDNGKNGDLLAGDGIYASTISVISDLGSINYYCKLEEHISKTIYLYFFERPTEESILEIQKIQANIIAIEETFCSDNGYIKESNLSDVMEEVEK